MILMNDFKKMWSHSNAEILNAVSGVGESGWLILGSKVKEFESKLAAEVGFKSSIGVANGMDAIEISLRAAGLVAGQKVITTPLSAFATTLAIYRAGGIPVFVDVDAHGLIDLDQARKVLAEDKSIKFMVPVHLYGFVLNLDRLESLVSDFGLTVIEDCAQSIGARWGGRVSGSVGRLAATSFYPTKNLGCMGDGGAILANDAELEGKCRTLRDYGQSEKYVHTEIGLNSRLDEVQAAIMTAATLPKLKAQTQRRTEIADFYLKNLRHLGVVLMQPHADMQPVWHLFPTRVKSGRDSLMKHLTKNGVQSGIHYPILITDQVALKKFEHSNATKLTEAASLAAEELSLPIHPYLTDSEIEKVVTVVNDWQA